MNLLPEMVEQIMSALSPENLIDTTEVHRRVGCWARGTIQKALVELEHRGQVSSMLTPHRRADVIRLWRIAEREVLIAAE